MPISKSLCNSVKEMFEKNDLKTLNNFIRSSQFVEEYLPENGSSLVSIICDKLTEELWNNDNEVFLRYEEILRFISENGDCDNMLLELLDQIEKTDIFRERFLTVVNCLAVVLRRLGCKRCRYLEWSIDMIANYINDLNTPADYYLEGEEKKLLKCDENVQNITYIYEQVLIFSESFLNDPLNTISTSESEALLLFYFRLLGVPAIYVDLEYNAELRLHCNRIVKHICSVVSDVISLLEHIDEVNMKKNSDNTDDDEKLLMKSSENLDLRKTCDEINFSQVNSPPDYRSRISDISLGGFFYLLFCHGNNENSNNTRCCCYIPAVYDTLYIYHKLLCLSVELLNINNNIVHKKGLTLSRKILESIPNGRIDHSYLALEVHKKYIYLLSSIGVYCSVEEIRTDIAKLFAQYFYKFSPKAKYLLFSKIAHLTENSSLDGYVITLFKEQFNSLYEQNALGEYFTGKRFVDLVYYLCLLKDGVKTDLVQNSSQIVAGLNLLRFIYIKDRLNLTKFWNYIDKFKTNYYIDLKEAVTYSKGHYNLRVHELEENEDQQKQQSNSDETSETAMNVMVEGKPLDPLKNSQKIEVVKSGLTTIDLIESLLERVNEIVNSRDGNLSSQV